MMTATPMRAHASILTNTINISRRSSALLSDDDNVSTSSSITARFSTALAHSSSSEDVKEGAGSKRQSLRIKSHEAPSKPKRKRISQEQFQKLTELFEQTDTPNYELREKLAVELNMTNREVQVWFQNRRAKYNRARQQEQQRNQQLALQKHHHYSHSHQYQHCREEMLIYAPHSPNRQDHHRYYYYDATQQQHQQHQRRWQEDTRQHYSQKQQRHQQQKQQQQHPVQPVHQYQDPCDSYSSTSSSSSSNVSTPTSPYPTLSPNMAPLEILAIAADYIQRFDQEEGAQRRKQQQQQQQQQYAANKKRRLDEPHDKNTQRSWRPWL